VAYLVQDLIARKRAAKTLTSEQIDWLVQGITDESVSDSQIAAMTMAICLQGMNGNETGDLTRAMRDSGKILDWSGHGLSGPLVDKHSTGGVGDLVSLPLGPMLAACGAHVPSISGRGLGHTGGTLDKLSSIPGYNVALDIERFQQIVAEVGVAIVGQTHDLAPADRRVYAVRDATATVDSVPLIVASILSKKLAEGLDGLVLDVKVGSGAVFPDQGLALELAQNLVNTAVSAGCPCRALITDMDQPLANTIGNALEVREAVDFLTGNDKAQRLHQVTLALGCEILELCGLADNHVDAARQLETVLENGSAAEIFGRMVAAQGGPTDFVTRPEHYLPEAPVIKPVNASRRGQVQRVDALALGRTVAKLGGGRLRASDQIDVSVGISQLCQAGLSVKKGEPLALLHAASEENWATAAAEISAAIDINKGTPPRSAVILRRIEATSGRVNS
jgi:thymidine phosphorylase